jgi:murein DD-endopeptidase MepM/ murein hydrolase activator NlpD
MESRNKYLHPVKEEDTERLRYNSPAHTGKLKHAVDYMCKENTELLAAQDGEVVWVKEDSNIGGPDKKYWNEGNRVVIKHENGEYSAYEHLKYKGSKVKVGDKVKKGQLIGYSGNTGYTFGPHLHFEVFKFTGPNKDEDFETLKINFNEKRQNKNSLENKIISGLFILTFLVGIIFTSFNLTGNAISTSNTTHRFIGIILFLLGISGFFIYKKLRS